jgi:nucleotide-binding universal stress UspA family protein
MRALIWIAENTWEACVDHARALLPADAEFTLLHVSPSDVEDLAAEGPGLRFGRRRPPPPGPPLRAIAEEDAQTLLEQARARLDRPADVQTRRGRVEREVANACAGFDVLVLARDGKARLGPSSFGPRTRFVVDHAPCQVLVVWAFEPPGLETIPPPPHEHEDRPPPPHEPPPDRRDRPPPPHEREDRLPRYGRSDG